MKRLFVVLFASLLVGVVPGFASSVLERSLQERVALADAVFRGEVAAISAFRPQEAGPTFTRTVFRVHEVFKGRVPPLVKLVHRGGFLGAQGETDGLAPVFQAGQRRLVFVNRQPDGTLSVSLGASGAVPIHGIESKLQLSPPGTGGAWVSELRANSLHGPLPGADITDQAVAAEDLLSATVPLNAGPSLSTLSAATNLMVDPHGISARFLAGDRDEAIPYYIDADALPSGMTLVQALKAVTDALAAWSKVASLKFSFAGMRSFGMPAANLTRQENALFIQLHDSYQFITGPGEILGRGGSRWAMQNLPEGWTLGGNVGGNDFHKVVFGWVVLQHSNPFMRNPTNFTEVLSHEVGHALSLGHSSDDPAESNPVLQQAIMYYTAHGDGRGASLNAFDVDVVQQVHPKQNTPPFCFDRFIDAITTPTNRAGLNRVRFSSYDLQTTNLTLEIAGATTHNGRFSVAGQVLQYDAFNFASGPRFDPASQQYYDRLYARVSDGTNASPFTQVTVLGLYPDNYYEGIPDDWRLTHFGSKSPTAGPNRRANEDFDSDGFSNLTEFHLGSDPANPLSNLKLRTAAPGALQWEAKPYEVYELYMTGDFGTWLRAAVIAPTNTPAVYSAGSSSPRQFFRVLKVW